MLGQPMRSNALMTVHTHRLVQPQVSMGTGASNRRCSDAMTSFRRRDYPAILRVALYPIHKYMSERSLYFYSPWLKQIKVGPLLLNNVFLVCAGETALSSTSSLAWNRRTRTCRCRDSSSPGNHFSCASPASQGIAPPSPPSSPRTGHSNATTAATLQLAHQQRLHPGFHGGGAWSSVHDIPVFLSILFLHIFLFHRKPRQPGLPVPSASCQHPGL